LIRWILRILAVLIAIIIIVPVALVIALNTAGGRDFAARKIGDFTGGKVIVAGLGGHFPADIKIAHLSVADANGVWLGGDALELRWQPAALLSRTIHVTSLTANSLDVARAPVATQTKNQSSSSGLPNLHLAVDELAVNSLNIGAALAGQPVTLDVHGSAHVRNPAQGDATLDAEAANGQGSYRLTAAIDHQNVNTVLHISEPPDGLLGHYAGPQVHAPLTLDLTLNGPRGDAALNFAAALGAAKLDGAGTLSLDPDAPKADIVFTVPSLAPVAAIARQNIAGNTTLHLIVERRNNVATISLDGDVALTTAPGPAVKLVGQNGHLSALIQIANNTVDLKNLDIKGAGFAIGVDGTVAQSGIDLNTRLRLNNVADVAPGISGGVSEAGTIIGTQQDFAVHSLITGDVSDSAVPTGPFSITLDAAHLPSTPSGTVIGTGALEGYPLALDAQFARDATGATTVKISQADWRSLAAQADVSLAQGQTLPTGTAAFAIKRLADFAKFSPVPLAGSIDGNFAHQNAQNFALNVNAQNLVVSPAIGAITATLNANGPTDALAVKFQAAVAKLMGFPARIASSGAVDIDDRSLNLNSFTASWRTINAVLQGPATVQTQPAIAIHHLSLGLNGGSVKIDGTVSPSLNVRVAVSRLPVSLATLFAPTLKASGTVSATANLTGSYNAPAGNITFNADEIALHSGPAAALPPANLAATATLAGKAANLKAKLGAGPNVTLNADGLVPLTQTGAINLGVTGRTDLRLLDPILAAAGTTLRGIVTPDVTFTGTPSAPAINGAVVLADGSVQNIGSGLSLTKMAAHLTAANKLVTLQDFIATAGPGTITGHGTVDLAAADDPLDLAISASNARPVSSDLITENLNAALTIKGSLMGAKALAGRIDILSANINIPKSLPPSVADLPIVNRGETPPPPPPPAPDIALNLLLHAHNQLFIRGDGLFAELGGRVNVTGTAADPDPQGGFTLIRGTFALGGKTLQFTKGVVSFNGAGFMPTLDLEATTTSGSVTTSLVITGTAAKPIITLTSSPPLPSDEVLAYLLFGQGTQNLSAFQAAQLAAALASLAGIGGGASPLDSVRNALGLDELSLGGSGSGPPTVNAGRYVAPGVYVGASQSTTGQGTQATVEINLYKGLKLNTSTGTSGSSGNSSSVGLTYQFNY
jgi:translocation and assembly module TamB